MKQIKNFIDHKTYIKSPPINRQEYFEELESNKNLQICSNLLIKHNVIAEVQITYSSKIKCIDRIKVTNFAVAASVFKMGWPSFEHIEFLYLLLLNSQNQIIVKYFLAKGGLTGTVIYIRVIFQVALKTNTSSIMMAHNHPSGNLQPSDEDKKITRQIRDAGAILEIPLLDHFILTEDSYLSLADEGMF